MSKRAHGYMGYVWEILAIDTRQERRSVPRYAVKSGAQAVLAWSVDQRHEERPGRILDLSQQGARIEVNGPVPVDAPSWLRLTQPVATDWMATRIIAVKGRFRSPRVVRLTFNDPCPYDIFTQAIQGFGAPDGGPMTTSRSRPPKTR